MSSSHSQNLLLDFRNQNILSLKSETDVDEKKDNIEVIVNPSEKKYTDCFMKTWESKEINQFLPQRSLIKELWETIGACGIICKTLIKSRLLRRENNDLINVESSVKHG